MARLAFINLPAYGHVNPTLATVAELVRRGESVVYYCSEEFRKAIEQTGAEFRAYPAMNEDTGKAAAGFLRLARELLETTLTLLPNLLADLRNDPVDYVIHDSVCPWGRFVAQRLGLPAIASTAMFALEPSLILPDSRLAQMRSILSALTTDLRSVHRIRQARERLASQYGITETKIFDVLINRAPRHIVYTSRLFQPREELFDGSFRFVGPSLMDRGGEAEFAHELGEGPVIYIALGTIFNHAPDFYRTCMAALGGLEQRVVMSVGRRTDVQQLGPIPANFLVRNWVPQLLVLSKAALYLTRCGFNSANESLYHGVPMLLFPEMLDQQLVARRVRDLGAGVILNQKGLRAKELLREVRRVMESGEFRKSAERVGLSLREAGGYQKAADEILQYRAKLTSAGG